jgi:hypothetical protein
MQENNKIRELKGDTSSIYLPGMLLRLQYCCPYLTASRIVLGPYAPLCLMSHSQMSVLAGQWMGLADNNLLNNKENVDITDTERKEHEVISLSSD